MPNDQIAIDAPGALPRDLSRFRRFYPSGRAVIRENPDPSLPYLTSAEMANENERKE